jgi:hypothetical protein
MSTECWTPFRAQNFRATRLDGCGAPVIGAKSTVVSDGLISVAFKINWDDQDDLVQKNAAGAIKLNVPGVSQIKSCDVTLTMIGIDPDLYEMWTGQPLVMRGANATGFRGRGNISSPGVALETWSLVDTDDCDGDNPPYGYFLLPRIVKGKIGDATLNDGKMDCILTGTTRNKSQWGTGPYDVVMDAATPTPAAGPLADAIDPDDHFHWDVVTVPPPDTNACGAVALAA